MAKAEGITAQGVGGRTPLSGGPSRPRRVPLRLRVKRKSVRFALVLYKIETRPRGQELSRGQLLWFQKQQAKLGEAELAAALRIKDEWLSNPELLERHVHDLEDTEIHALPLTMQLPEPRRIGKGYTDKGSLRPAHERRDSSDEDIRIFPRWIRSSLKSQDGNRRSTTERILEQLSPSEVYALCWHIWTRAQPNGKIVFAQDFERALDRALATLRSRKGLDSDN